MTLKNKEFWCSCCYEQVNQTKDVKEFIKDLIIKCPQCKLMITKLAGDLE